MVQQGCCADIMESAFSYAGREMETEAPKTEAPETQAPETQAPAQTTEPAGKSGCGSMIGFGAIAVVAAAAAAVALKKKD